MQGLFKETPLSLSIKNMINIETISENNQRSREGVVSWDNEYHDTSYQEDVVKREGPEEIRWHQDEATGG